MAILIAKGAYPGIYGAKLLNIIVNDNNLAIYMDRVLVYEGNDFATDFHPIDLLI